MAASEKYDPTPQLSQHGQIERFTIPFNRITSVTINSAWSQRLSQDANFFIATWLDWLFIVIIGATAAGVWTAPHTFTRLFPVTAPDGTIYWPDVSHPYVEPIFSSALAGVLAAIIPIVVFALAQLFQHSFTDFASAVLGLAYSMVTATSFQVILKKTIGGLRPHFLAVCEPVFPPRDGSAGTGYANSMFTAAQLCTGDAQKIRNALESFPSGHATIAFAGFGYLAIYLFAHLQVRNPRRRPSYWRMLAVVAPLLFATYLTGTLVLGCHHFGTDALAGAFIGWVMAFLGYRMVYRGVWDPERNTVPYLRLHEGDGDRLDSNLGRHEPMVYDLETGQTSR